jgi:DNA-binding NtrC family response regulator
VREPKPVDTLASAVTRGLTLEELEREYIQKVVNAEAGNKTRAAQRLGLDRKTLYRKLEEYGARQAQASAHPANPRPENEDSSKDRGGQV